MIPLVTSLAVLVVVVGIIAWRFYRERQYRLGRLCRLPLRKPEGEKGNENQVLRDFSASRNLCDGVVNARTRSVRYG